MNNNHIINAIKDHISKNKDAIVAQQHLAEPALLDHIRFGEDLSMDKQQGSAALFGYPSLNTDFVPKYCPSTVIEVKRIGFKNDKGIKRRNEYDIKNGLAQVLEQAFCRKATSAILVILDGGSYSDTLWNNDDNTYADMFVSNTLGITLSILRARFPSCGGDVQFEMRPDCLQDLI